MKWISTGTINADSEEQVAYPAQRASEQHRYVLGPVCVLSEVLGELRGGHVCQLKLGVRD